MDDRQPVFNDTHYTQIGGSPGGRQGGDKQAFLCYPGCHVPFADSTNLAVESMRRCRDRRKKRKSF